MLSAIPRAIAALALLAVLLAAPAAAQEAPKPQIYNSSSKYIYQGCYNETLNMPNTAHVRAIADGNITTSKTNMTITACLSYCNNNNFKYAGIEYGEYVHPLCFYLLRRSSASIPSSMNSPVTAQSVASSIDLSLVCS